jgi:hypothetical protein
LKRDMLGPLRSCEADVVDAGLIGTPSLTREGRSVSLRPSSISNSTV